MHRSPYDAWAALPAHAHRVSVLTRAPSLGKGRAAPEHAGARPAP